MSGWQSNQDHSGKPDTESIWLMWNGIQSETGARDITCKKWGKTKNTSRIGRKGIFLEILCHLTDQIVNWLSLTLCILDAWMPWLKIPFPEFQNRQLLLLAYKHSRAFRSLWFYSKENAEIDFLRVSSFILWISDFINLGIMHLKMYKQTFK